MYRQVIYKPRDVVFINGKRHMVIRQVLFNQPAYKVVLLSNHGICGRNEYVIDGNHIHQCKSDSELMAHALKALGNAKRKKQDKDVMNQMDRSKEGVFDGLND